MTITNHEASYTTTFTVDRSPDEVFAAINDVRGWWAEDVEGNTEQLDDEFTFQVDGVHRSRQRITESVPGTRVVWQVVDSSLEFAGDKTEWTGTEIAFDIAAAGDRTEVRFTHVGLVPDYECFDSCSNAWSFYVGDSLRSLITIGKGRPIQQNR